MAYEYKHLAIVQLLVSMKKTKRDQTYSKILERYTKYYTEYLRIRFPTINENIKDTLVKKYIIITDSESTPFPEC